MELHLTLFKYFAGFVKKQALRNILANPGYSQRPGYAEVAADILNAPDTAVIDRISNYVFSMNEKYVSDHIRNNKDIILYVEYGALSYNPVIRLGVKQKLAVYVAYPCSIANNDNLNETLLMAETFEILTGILDRMEADQSDLGFCGNTRLINFPSEIFPIEESLFYGHSGWMAIFDYEKTNLI
ncbi:MAG: hypothetical protein LBR26_13320 [Prevotella sp.]|jgi:hypothetical protein|nr:hypothetical protein [Prevotella sp.]